MKVLRSSFVAAVAIFAAACGDKVNIVQPGTPADGVSAVTVAPGTATMAVGNTVSFSAIVTATGAAATTVTWSSSDASKVSVTAAGVATAVAATPGVAICATSTVNANAKGCASVSVIPGSPTSPPSVSISAVNFTNAFGQQQPAPVPPAGVGTGTALVGSNQLNVIMNVNAGTAVLDSVVLKVGGKNAYKQSFSATQSAALLTESLEQIQAAGGETANQLGTTITASFNSADYSPTTGLATWQNGNNAIQAFIYGKNAVTAGSSPTTVQGNSPASTYRFANADGFHLAVTYAQAAAGARTAGETQVASAVDAAGYGWKSGAMSLSALFVQYTPGTTPAIVTATFNNLGCASVAGVRTITLTNTGTGTPVVGPYTGTFSNTATAGATNVTGYTWSPAIGGTCALPGGAAAVSGGEIPAIGAVGSDNNNLVLVAAGINGGAGILNTFANSLNPDPNIVVRLDNVGPGGVQLIGQSSVSANLGCAIPTTVAPTPTSLGGRTNCWFNDAVVLNGRHTGFPGGIAAAQTSTNGIVSAAADLGVGRVIGTSDGITFTARVGLVGDANATIDANAAVTNVSGLPESGTSTAYRARVRAVDALGNTTNVGGGVATAASTTAMAFGRDNTAPVLTFIGGPAANARGLAAGGAYSYGATDNPGVGAGGSSGFFAIGATPLVVTQTRRDQVNGTMFFCPYPQVGGPTPSYVATGGATSGVCGLVAGSPAVTLANSWPAGNNPTYAANLTVSDVNLSGTNPTLDAYYTTSATVMDQAGMVSAAAARVQVVDATAPAAGGVLYSPILLTSGGAVTFSTAASDNLDLQLSRANVQYGAAGGPAGGFEATLFDASGTVVFTTPAGGSSFWYNDTPINGYNLTPLINTNFPISNAVASLVTHMQVTGAAMGVNPGAFGATNNVNTANVVVVNQATVAQPTAAGTFSIGTTPILGASLPAGVNTPTAITATGLAGAGPANWFICGTTGAAPAAGAACPVIPAGLGAGTIAVSRDGATAGQNTVVSFDAVATGATAVFTNPFSSVQFWAYDATAGATSEGWRLIGTQNSATTVTDGLAAAPNGRNWHFIVQWDPTATDAPVAAGTLYHIVAIGIGGPNLAVPTARGVGLVTPIGAITVTMNP